MADDTKPCACGGRIHRKNPTGRFPYTCEACKAKKAGLKQKQPKARTTAEEPTEAAVDVTDLIASLSLDYCVGSAARFCLESMDGNELDNLRAALTYLEKAIAAREATRA